MIFSTKTFGYVLQNFKRVNVNLTNLFATDCRNTKKCVQKAKSKILRDKVALVTGGGAGIGFQCAKEFLKKGALGVTIADSNPSNGNEAVKALNGEFGKGRAMYVRCDVTKSELFDWAYKQTLKHFGCLDLVVNNAGIMNDTSWEQSISTNIGGCIIGSLLAIQYMSKACAGRGGTVINVASTWGINHLCGSPIYSMTQAAIIAFSRALGEGRQYDRTGVKIVAVCPGATDTPLLSNSINHVMNDKFKGELIEEFEDVKCQPPECVARAVITVLKKAKTGSIWIVETGKAPFEIGLPLDFDDMKC